MKLLVEAIKNLLKLLLGAGAVGATGALTLSLLSNVQIGSQNPSVTGDGTVVSAPITGDHNRIGSHNLSTTGDGTVMSAPITGDHNRQTIIRDVDQSINKTGVVYNFYRGTENINNSTTFLDQSVTVVNNTAISLTQEYQQD